jgi:hypothetical protein
MRILRKNVLIQIYYIMLTSPRRSGTKNRQILLTAGISPIVLQLSLALVDSRHYCYRTTLPRVVSWGRDAKHFHTTGWYPT